jgi:hypothetical protein
MKTMLAVKTFSPGWPKNHLAGPVFAQSLSVDRPSDAGRVMR